MRSGSVPAPKRGDDDYPFDAMAPKKSVQLSGVVVAESAICSIDPDEGVLMYRGYDIADLTEHSTYEETALLLLDGELPSSEALSAFETELADRELPVETEEMIDRSAQPSERDARAFDVAMIIHAEHELNASTFTARVIAGTGADLTGGVVGAIAALSGPLHGGANEAAMRMFERWGTPEQTPAKVRAMLGSRTSGSSARPMRRVCALANEPTTAKTSASHFMRNLLRIGTLPEGATVSH